MSKSDNYTDVLLEEVNDKFDRIIDVVSQLQDELKRKPDREEFDELKSDVKVIKAALTDTNDQIQGHEKRITVLESM
jgi:hypothetical protein